MGVRASAAGFIVALALATTWPLSAAPGDTAPDVLISRQLMESQRLHVGDVVSLSSAASGEGARPFRIAGTYEPTPDPMRLGATRLEVRLHLPDLIDLAAGPDPADRESVDAINVALQNPAASRDAARRLTSGIPGIVTQRTGDDQRRTAPFVVLERFHFAIAIVTVLASSVFLLALMLMLVEERRSTVGILRMIGFRRRRILQHVLAEGVVIAIAGALFGILLSVGLQRGINEFFQWRYDTALIFVRITPNVAMRSIAVAVPLGVASIVASSWSLLRSEVFSLTRR